MRIFKSDYYLEIKAKDINVKASLDNYLPRILKNIRNAPITYDLAKKKKLLVR